LRKPAALVPLETEAALAATPFIFGIIHQHRNTVFLVRNKSAPARMEPLSGKGFAGQIFCASRQDLPQLRLPGRNQEQPRRFRLTFNTEMEGGGVMAGRQVHITLNLEVDLLSASKPF
jgi:hypothetical protein